VHLLFAGELAALGTAFCWSFSSIFFAFGGQRVGSLVVNRVRLVLAVLLVATTHLILMGRPFPIDAGWNRFFWLAVSAILGLVLGDSLLFQAYVWIGPRLSMLLMALAPIFGALLAWAFLGETLAAREIAAMLLALGGVAWVVMEGDGRADAEQADSGRADFGRADSGRADSGQARAANAQPRHYLLGVLCGLGGAAGQAFGLVAAKQGMVGDFPALSAVVIRMTVAMVVLWIWTIARGQAVFTVRAIARDRRAGLSILGGATAGPFLGVWLSLIAVQAARVGIASTLMAMTPVILLPLSHFVFHERVTRRSAAGTLLAMGGVALMLLI
jgi:drug/metabolite transporter (DMT)-like permease